MRPRVPIFKFRFLSLSLSLFFSLYFICMLSIDGIIGLTNNRIARLINGWDAWPGPTSCHDGGRRPQGPGQAPQHELAE